MNTERQEILQKLMHNPGMKFNELWGNVGESNKFAYHLKVLVEDGLIEKKDEFYSLTHEGKTFSTYLEGTDGSRAKFPALIVACVIYDKESDKYLFSRRTKEPFYGYWCWTSGKVRIDEFIYETAKKEIFEETGLTCDLELKGLLSAKTYDNNEFSYNHEILVVLGKNPKGDLIPKTREGEIFWLSEKEILEKKAIPTISDVLEISKSKSFKWIEVNRLQENDKFVGKKILRDIEF